ncbi:uncharacterized protein LOC101855243 [Aplysia californica]|uniref:Uncharacterized protein LOC101855243 n=1 Tax=Aplysia californica TaxID=6500 RepID=A0ABM0JJ86_APLCA|nr:uncharacterized protein LOC101855243 [Aplysia californica]
MDGTGIFEGQVYCTGCTLILPDLTFLTDILLNVSAGVTAGQEKQRLLREHYPAGKDNPHDFKIIIHNTVTRQEIVMIDSRELEEYCADLADDIELHIRTNSQTEIKPAQGSNPQCLGGFNLKQQQQQQQQQQEQQQPQQQ